MSEKTPYILMLVTYRAKPGQREAFHQAILDGHLQEASRKEVGNIAYDYFLCVDSADELLLVEKWKDEEVLAAHRTLPHFLQLTQLKDQYILDVSVIKTWINKD